MRSFPLLLALVLFCGSAALAQQPDLGTEAQREAGKQLYDKFCSQCHGINGDGQGVAATRLMPEPRDFTSGKYKIRATPSGALPTDEDLKSIIRRGMPYTSMPAWPQFNEGQLTNLVYYLKSFSEDFSNPDYLAAGMTIPKAPPMTEETIQHGREVYEQLGCIRCHGELGRSDGMSAPTLVDDWGDFIRTADLTAKWTFRGGATREDLFRTFSTGLNGTPMPSYADALSDEERWHLVDYVYALSDSEEGPYATLVIARPLAGQLDWEDPAEAFAAAPEAMFPVVGQIVEPGRNFHPLVGNVRVRAICSQDEIAFLVQWDDLLADVSGSNDPALQVPMFDDEAAAAAPAGEAEEDFWGEEEAGEEEEDFWGEEGEEAQPSGPVSEFSDAVAIQLPAEMPAGIRKPYFIFGDLGNPVDLWFVDLADGEARSFTGRGSASVVPVEGTDVTASSRYDNGQWSVVFRRPLRSLEGIRFDEGTFVPIAFSVWDGFNEERGNKRGLTQWFYVYVEPSVQASALGPMTRAALAVLFVEILLIVLIRWRHRKVGAPAVESEVTV